MTTGEEYFEQNSWRFSGKSQHEKLVEFNKMLDEYITLLKNEIRNLNPGISEAEVNILFFRTFYHDDFSESEMNKIVQNIRGSLT